MDGRWTGRCDETQDANRLPGAPYGQLSPAASSQYYTFSQSLSSVPSVSSVTPQDLQWSSHAGQRALPPRVKAGKVTKPGTAGRRDSRQPSLPSTAQGQIEHFVQQGNNNVDIDAAQIHQLANAGRNERPDGAINLINAGGSVHGSTSMAGLPSSAQNAFNTSGGAFRVNDGHQSSENITSPPQSLETNDASVNDASVKNDIPTPVQSAADVVLKMYQSVKIDSTLCKRLAGEAARREPTQRRRDQKLNIERRSNVEALLAHVTGNVAPQNNNPQHSLFTPTVQVPSDGAMMNFQQHPILTPNSPAMMASYHSDVAQWGMADYTNMVNTVMGETMALSKKARHLARIDSAAKELSIRIAEFEEFMQSPEGLAEQQREQRYYLAQQGQIGDVAMNGDSPETPVG
ncbi:hypothetical protein E4U42_004415 [Claviceps africana]|uniref:Uncharacterized protein n=1 Tax=Claviceps africana TaxID=83212 RepID=A0A8K0J5Q0_9HYPO|nr:hypothetical protein E4U42_004415 [Claviceps africana]